MLQVDIKCTVWVRATLSNEVTKEEVIGLVKGGDPFDTLPWADWETLVETNEFMEVNENNGQPTIEIMEKNGDTIWDNVKGDYEKH